MGERKLENVQIALLVAASVIGTAIRLKQEGIDDFVILSARRMSAASGATIPIPAARAMCSRICIRFPSFNPD